MSAIFGLVRLAGPEVGAHELEMMRAPMAYWGLDGGGIWRAGAAGLGQLVAWRTPEDEHESGPVKLANGAVVTAAGRLDNRDELFRELGVPSPERARTPDGSLIGLAYERWGDDAPGHLLGDWSFAAWDPSERRLFLARDHYGNTGVYYHRSGGSLAFASSLKGLLALPHVPRRLNELQFARSLVLALGDGEATMYEGISRLPTAHALSFDATHGLRTREFWSLLDAPEVRLGSDDEYVERLLDLFSLSVRSRLRSRGPVAATLSGGLDSAAVVALAAGELGEAPLAAYTSRPAFPEVAAEMPGWLVDEWPLAAAVASRYGNVRHLAVEARDVSPVAAIEHALDVHEEPEHAIANLPWMRGLLDDARAGGARVLLSGQMGNGSFSWPGDRQRTLRRLAAGDLRSAYADLRHLRDASRYGWAGALWHGVAHPLRVRLAGERMLRDPARQLNWRESLIQPSFAARVGLPEVVRASGWDPQFTRASERSRRLSGLLPGLLPIGAWWHQRGAAHGIEVRDPTTDVRLLEFCVGVPDDQFARGAEERWLARRMLDRLVPPEVAWNRRRGVQAADFAYRLRADSAAVSTAVERVAGSRSANERLDVEAVRAAWLRVAAGNSAGANEVARGLGSGLFLLRVADR